MSDNDSATTTRHSAGALDIRNIIGGLLGVYGVILLLLGIFDYGDTEADKTGDINANLWAGLAIVLGAAVFLVWARLRPIIVPDHVDPPADPARPPGP